MNGGFLFHAHSGLRYLVLLAGVAALLWAVFAALTRRPYGRPMRILASSFAGLLHLQVLLGFALLFTGRFYTGLIGHFFAMLLAAATAQVVPSVMRRRPPEARSHLPHAVAAAVALALIVVGILAIGRGPLEMTGG